MDLLHSRYADPDRFMNTYIAQGRFGEFVTNMLEMDARRKQEAAKKSEDDRLWLAYILSMTDKSYYDWKAGLLQGKGQASYAMTDRQVRDVRKQARGILDRISPG